jgi:DNA recombination protein RmuC
MDATSLIVIVLILLASFSAILWLFLQAQKLRLAKLSAEEKLTASQNELAGVHERLRELQAEQASLETELQARREENASLRTSLQMEKEQTAEKLKLLNESREQLSVAFKNIANEIFEDKTKKFNDVSKDSLATLLNPLQEKISQFEKRVEETYDKESKDRFSLTNEIKNLQELNKRISEDAVNLTNALKGDNKAQGNWGEFVLESILEKSGLVKGREYDVQVNLRAEDGSKLQPDIVVHLPESRDIIIDSKVSLKAWDDYCSTDDEDKRAEYLKQHIQSLRLHVKNLAGKDYQNLTGLNSLDYVCLFMPIEAAYAEAARHDSELLTFAFERNIVFVVPSTLLAILKTVQNLWRLAQQSQNASEIARRAGDLYDKFAAFVGDLQEVGNKLDATQKTYDKAFNKLKSGRGNLLKRVETLKKLGAKTSKQLDQDMLGQAEESDAEQLTGPDSESGGTVDADDSTRH